MVAAGLTPGFIAASAAGSSIQGPNTGTTAAEVVAIDGQAYSFDELYAMQNPDSAATDTIELNIVLEPTNATLYGAPVVIAYGTTKYGVQITRSNDGYEVIEGDTIYRSVAQAPYFPGGDDELMKYIDSQIQYPANALLNRVQGRIVVKFVVKSTGEIGTVRVIHSVDKELADEAVRVVKSLPNFVPARLGGKAVASWHMLPVTFTLPKENDN